MRHNWFLFALLLIAGCSGLRPPLQPAAKEDADYYLHFALQMEAVKEYSQAKEAFSGVLINFRSFADNRGQLAALSGLARIALATGEDAEYQRIIVQMQEYVNLHGTNLDYYPLILKVDKLMAEGDYAAASKLAIAKPGYLSREKLRLATAKLQADSYLRTATAEQAKDLLKMSKQHHKQLRKRKAADTELLSAAWYSLGYYHYSKEEYEAALGFVDRAANWDYRYGDFAGYGHSLWLKAQVLVQMQRKPEAISLYNSARDIFAALGEKTLAAAIERELNALLGEN